MSKRIILLIHGVGGAVPGELQNAVREHTPYLGVNPPELHEYRWNYLIDRPARGEISTASLSSVINWLIGSETSTVYLSSVIRGLIGSAMVDDVSHAACIIRAALFTVLGVAPLLAIWGFILGIIWLDHRLPDLWRPLVIPLDMLLIPAMIMFRSLMLHSTHVFQVSLIVWSCAVFAIGTIYGLICVMQGPGHLFPALRTVVVACTWPPVGILGFVFSLPPLLVLFYALFAAIGFAIRVEGNVASGRRAPAGDGNRQMAPIDLHYTRECCRRVRSRLVRK